MTTCPINESTHSTERQYWLSHLERLALPVLAAAAQGKLLSATEVEVHLNYHPDGRPSGLEALARTLAGIAPWLASDAGDEPERDLRQRLQPLVDASLDRLPTDFPLGAGRSALVEGAFLSHALVRYPAIITRWSASVRERLQKTLEDSRRHLPVHNNWSCFSAMVEAGVEILGGTADPVRIDHCLRQHESWYLGDGIYGDGPELHADYYNSFVIQPMLIDLLARFAARQSDWQAMVEPLRRRAVRHAALLERMIAPDGSFPVIGRSIVYRCGAFQHLAQAALQNWLPAEILPGQARSALTAVIRRTLDAPGTYRADGFLAIGLCGHQPSLGESYISTGSLYLCTTALLPLGLPPTASFWSDPDRPWTGQRIWSGVDGPSDHALTGLIHAPPWTRGG